MQREKTPGTFSLARFGLWTLTLLVAAALPASGQLAPRPDSRHSAYPTASPLPPPPTLRFEAAWEHTLEAEHVVSLVASKGVVWALSEEGRLTGWDPATGEAVIRLEGFDPAAPLASACGAVLARSREGTLRLVRAGEEPLSFAGLPADARPLGSVADADVDPDCGRQIAAGGAGLLALVAPRTGTVESKPVSGAPMAPPATTRGRLWNLMDEDGTRRLVGLPLGKGGETTSRRLSIPASGASWIGASDPSARHLAVAGDLWMASRDAHTGKPRWRARLLTGAGTTPLVLTTRPAPGSKEKPETLVLVGTLDGDVVARREDNGHLAWSARAAGRIARPPSVWIAPETPGDADRTRVFVGATGGRKIEAFRVIDGFPAGALQLGTESATIAAGPVIAATADGGRCIVAWSPWAGAASRLLSLRLL